MNFVSKYANLNTIKTELFAFLCISFSVGNEMLEMRCPASVRVSL